jgi:serine/threonine protein kinase
MDIDRRRRHVAAVYRFIIAQPLGQRAQLIDQFCSADPTIREELNELLADSGSRASEATTSLTQLDSLVEPPGGTGEGGDDPSAHVILHYRLLHRLGEGGMGVVYKAHDMRLSRPVAVKFSKDESATNQAVLDEARAASALNHPNICTIHAVEEVPRNQLSLDAPGDSSLAPFIVMEYVDGTRLADQVRKGRLSPQRCLDVAVQLCRGIVAAHAQRIIHCDIKPHNVMVSPGGLIKIMDFGLARMSTQRPSSMAPLSIVGTVGYMSPEQAAGAPLDARTDLFSVGVLLYEIATACRPFESTDLRTFRSEIAEMTVASPSELAPELPLAFDRIVMRCLSAERAERYQTAAELLADLELLQRELLTDGPQRSTLPGTDPHGQTRETERRRATVVMGEILPVAAEQDPGPLLTAVFDAIAKHGGTIDRVSGSSFVAFFGLPSASEHSTRNAVKAAIDIRNRTRTEAAPTTGVRLALCTGAVLAGTVGSGMQRRYSVTGEAVDGAADILTRVPPGHIYVGAATEADTRRDFVFDRVATAGESGPVFDVTATLQVDRADPPASALLGREAEVRILAAALKALREGQGRLVTVIGRVDRHRARRHPRAARPDGFRRPAPRISPDH